MKAIVLMRDLPGRNSSVASELMNIASEENLDLHTVEIDVTNNALIDKAVAVIVKEKGRIDVLVNNAGVMNVGITEGYTLE